MSLGLLFPGQASQHAGMLPWLDADAGRCGVLKLLQHELGTDWRRHSADTAWATRNDVAQRLLTGLCLAAWQQLKPLLPAPAVIAGYSVGELAAYSAAGVFDAETAWRLAGQRAAIMDACVQGTATGLLSLSGAAPMLIERLCRAHRLAVAICIGVDRCLVGGLLDNLSAAEREATSAGASCKRLSVPLASHTPLLAAGVAPLAAVLEGTTFAVPHTPLVVGLTGQVLRGAGELRQALAQQMASTLRWDWCMDTLAERGVRCVLEVGPGSALAQMWRARVPDVPARSVDEFQSPAGVARWVADMLSPS
jgi:[acyl-carrier-protein] S-malonyltransferase